MMKMRAYLVRSVYGLMIGLAAIGCGGEKIKGIDPNLVSVTGKVSLSGKSLTTGTILFVPVDPKGKGATSPIDSSGNYALAVSASAKGALPGSYKVTVTATDGIASMGMSADMGSGKAPEAPKVKSLIPEKYNSIDTSGLTATVEKGKSNSIPFDLKP